MLSNAYATSNYSLLIPPSPPTEGVFVGALRPVNLASTALPVFLIGGPIHSAAEIIMPSAVGDKQSFSSSVSISNANSLMIAVDYQVETARTILDQLVSLKSSYPSMSAQIADAQTFSESLPFDIPLPSVWTDGECEVVLEWISGSKHAVVSFEGDGEFGYTMMHGDRFLPGRFPGNSLSMPPKDLIDYIASS